MNFLLKIVYQELPRCGSFEFRTTDRTKFLLLLHHTKSASLNGHSLTHIKIYYSSDNFNESTSSISGPQRWQMKCLSNPQPSYSQPDFYQSLKREFNEQEEKMIMMVTTHFFSPSPKLKSFKEAIGKCKLIFGAS